MTQNQLIHTPEPSGMAQPRRLRGGLSADLSLSEPRRREAALIHGAIIFDSKDS
jgi:hypothetical protein